MPIQLKEFFNKKTVQRSYQFDVDFVYTTHKSLTRRFASDPILKQFLNVNDNFPIKSHHVKNAILPQNAFKKEIQKIGVLPKTFPVFDSDGLELRIELEEDEQHNVSAFIHFLQMRIMNQYGFYTHPNDAMIESINIDILKNSGSKIATYEYKNCYFMNSSEPNYAYNNNESISYVLTFNADTYNLHLYS